MSDLPDTPKRFVAGAKCPQCQVLDKVVIFRKAGVQFQACVSCGYEDKMAFERNFRELETRVNRTEDEKLDTVSVVRLIDSGAAKTD